MKIRYRRILMGCRKLFAIVSQEDFDSLSVYGWSVTKTGYAKRTVSTKGRKVSVYMHREVCSAPSSMDVDHKNRNRLDNRRENLRPCTRSQNLANQPPRRGRYKGVCFSGRENRWRATSQVDGKQVHIGYYDNAEDAAMAYDSVATRHFGEFAYLNFPNK